MKVGLTSHKSWTDNPWQRKSKIQKTGKILGQIGQKKNAKLEGGIPLENPHLFKVAFPTGGEWPLKQSTGGFSTAWWLTKRLKYQLLEQP